jgi:hypothetical protein
LAGATLENARLGNIETRLVRIDSDQDREDPAW